MILPFIKLSIASRVLFLIFLFTDFHREAEMPKEPADKSFAVVELFTSEGCSSCPPADAAVAEILTKYKGRVYVLGFHVDYWNRLGWTDEFSSAAYSKRQGAYANAFALQSIYTPQIVVNGEKQFVGSNKTMLDQTVQAQLKEKRTVQIDVVANAKEGNTIKVNCTMQAAENSFINIALVQLEARSSIKRGENKGLDLHHVNVVRDFVTLAVKKDKPASCILRIPTGLTAKDCKVIAYTQDKNNDHISGAVEAVIQ